MKKALIHDWYYFNGGAEKVIHSINNIWGDLDHFSLIDFLNDEDRNYTLHGKNAKTSFIQKLPFSNKNHRKYLQLFPLAIEQFDLSDYDLIISSSSSVAKGVLTHGNQLHISYVHSPMRYAWDLYHQYLNEAGLNKGIKGAYAKWVLNKIRVWDVVSTNRVDHIVANSNYIARRINKVYRRKADVIYPPVDIDKFSFKENKDNYYLTASRLVPYKKIDIIVEAFSKLKDKKLVVVGDGPEMNKIKSKATKNIEILGYQEDKVLIDLLQNAKAFIFSAEEDFGIIPVEAQACGTPVIAFGKGGVLETVEENVSGCFFKEQSPNSILDAISVFDNNNYDPFLIRKNSEKFSRQRFENQFQNYIDEKVKLFYN